MRSARLAAVVVFVVASPGVAASLTDAQVARGSRSSSRR